MSQVQVSIHYATHDDAEERRLDLSPTDYFDLQPGEKPSLEGVPRRGHAVDYLEGVNVARVKWTRLTLTDLSGEIVITERLWNGGRNRLIERTDRTVEPGWELTYTFDNPVSEGAYEVMRITRDAYGATLLSHVTYVTNSAGEERKYRIYPE